MPATPFPELNGYLPGATRQPRPQTDNAESWLSEEMRKKRDEQIRKGLAVAPPPDTVARTTRVARSVGSPPAQVEGNEDTAESLSQSAAVSALAKRYPAIGKFATNNPRGIAAARDDAKSLGMLGEAWNGLKAVAARTLGTGGFTAAGMLNDLYGVGQQAAAVVDAPFDLASDALYGATGYEVFNVDRMRRRETTQRQARRDYFQQGASRIREANRGSNWLTEGLLQGTESAAMTGLAILSRNPEIAASTLGAGVGASAFETARAQGVDVPTALRYAGTQGVVEAATEKIPAGTLVDLIARKTPWGKAFVRELGQEMTGEQVATYLQDFNDWAVLPENRSKTLADFARARPEAALQTGLAVAGGTTVTTGTIAAAQRATDATRAVAGRVAASRQAKAEGQFVDRMEKVHGESKLRARDPEAFRDLMREHAEEAGTRNIYIPAEAVREFQQSDSFDQDNNPFDQFSVDEAHAAGGDVVIPIEDALTDLVGTPAWAAVKDHVRLTPGGMSRAEADQFEGDLDKTVGEIADRMAASSKDEAKAKTVRDALVDQVAAQFGESYTAPAARNIAEIAVQRAEARAARMGVDLTGKEFEGFSVRQVMPEGVAEAAKADDLDLVINAMRGRGDVEIGQGPTVLEAIKARGGINDPGGDLASMGVPKALLRDTSQASFGGLSGAGDYGIDTTLRALIEDGFFPELAGIENEQGTSQLDTQALLDAIGAELAGSPSYSSTKRDFHREAGDDLRQMLEASGLDPDAMSDADVRKAVEGMGTQASEGGFEQSAERGPRGKISFKQNHRIIELFQSRNLSTALHELSHMWLEELRFDAEHEAAPEQVRDDWAKVQSWFAANGHAVRDGQIPVEAHELWARSGERYFMEGKAPTTALTRLFETFRSWLVNIYKTVDRLRAPITPEIREVFDRLLATDEEIAQVAEQQNIAALFKDAAEIGMTGPEFAAYQAQVEDARAGAHAKLLDKTMATIRRREQDRYSEARKNIRAEETERIDGSPLYKALRTMKDTRLSKDWLTDRFGEDVTDLLPVRVPPIFSNAGSDPEVVAELSGYPTAHDMIEALIGAERAQRQAKEGGDQRSMRARAIETATDEEFARRYGDPLNDGSIEREALAAVHSEMQGEVIATELRVLARKTGQRPTPYRIARDWARGKIRSGIVVDEASASAIQRYARNAAKAGRAAEQAMLKQDVEETFRQKQFQMVNNALLAEAKEAGDEVAAAVKRMDKIARAKTRKSVDQDYLEQAQTLLEAVDLRKRSQVGLDKAGKFEAWAAAREAEGYDIVAPPSLEAMLGKTNWSRLSVESLLALDEQIKQIIHLGRLKQTLMDNAEEREWDEIIREAGDSAGNIKGSPPADLAEPGWWGALKAGAMGIDAGLLKLETVFDWLDGGNPNGVFNRIAFRPIADAQGRERDMLKDYYARIKARFEAVPGAVARRWNDRLSPPWIDPHTEMPMVINRKQAVAMALNVGNEGNLQRLSDGYHVNPEALIGWLDATLSAEEWAFVQGVWDDIDTLWPMIEAVERKVNGVAPEKIAPRSFETSHGLMRGGYYPAVYDTTRDYTAEEHGGKESDLLSGRYTKATTRSSATKERAEKVKRPILLDLGVINRHLGEVIHDITHREAVIRANRFLTNGHVRRAVDLALGNEIGKQLRPWVKFVANSWAMERAGNEGLGKWLGKLRANVTAVGMGLRATTMVTQISGYSNSFEVVGEQWVAPQIARFAASPVELTRFVMERSDEVRHRMDTLDRDIRRQLAIVAASNPASKTIALAQEGKRFFFHGIGYMDRVVSIPTWLGAYNKALAGGANEADAAYAGDKAVRVSQGAGGAKDLAAIQRGTGQWGKALELMTMFYSFFSAQYQRERTLVRDIAGKDARKSRSPRLAARAFWLLVVPPLLTEVLRGAVGAPSGPDDDEWWAQWTMRKMLANALGPIPVARDVFEPFWQGTIEGKAYNPSVTPIQRAYDSLFGAGQNIGKVIAGKETKHATKDTLELVGYATGLVPGQLASATQFLVDVGNDDAEPQGMSEWIEGLSTGKIND